MKFLRISVFAVGALAVAGCQAFLPAVSYTCRHGEHGPAASLEAAKINEELIYNLSALCAKEEANATEKDEKLEESFSSDSFTYASKERSEADAARWLSAVEKSVELLSNAPV